MKQINKIIKFVRLVLEGETLKDKLRIIESFFGRRKEIHLNNSDGRFIVGANKSDLWMCSPLVDIKLRKYFSLKEGVFLDIGANIGRYSIMVAKQLKENGRVIAFEPEPSNIESLKKNLKFNNISNTEVIPFALSNKVRKTDFFINPENTGGSSLVKESEQKIQVITDTLDNFVKQSNLKRIDLIKIDVEGAEADVLKGAIKTLKKSHPKIIFEAWNEEYLKKVEKVLKPFNYKIKKIAPENYIAD